jgi:hypothetical protein
LPKYIAELVFTEWAAIKKKAAITKANETEQHLGHHVAKVASSTSEKFESQNYFEKAASFVKKYV